MSAWGTSTRNGLIASESFAVGFGAWMTWDISVLLLCGAAEMSGPR
jgi:hypothetical protein